MAKLDIKDAYYTIEIKEGDQKLLKFKHKNKLYKFTSLPNGYTEAPRKFTKVLKPPLSNLQMEEKVLIASFIDDLTTMNHIEILCSINITKIIELVTSFGFVIHLYLFQPQRFNSLVTL